MKNIKNIVFDFGGVLIDWNPAYLYAKIFENETEMNFFFENICTYTWNLQQDAGRPLAEATRALQEKHPQFHQEIGMYYGRWEEMLGGTIDRNVRLIKPLKEKYKVYGLTNWSSETLPIAIAKYDFFDLLDGMVVSGEEKIVKPDARLYQILLERYHLDSRDTLFIDDNFNNIEAAKTLGFETIHVTEQIDLEKELKELNVL